ncbi:hypothetical protein [Solirubrobacter soli]|uniref:hypothetical protein n=1 Tax=Solirubrobacter soli TaxID=363832 RepID=UPI000427357E|nr:hypothetical protein [Solirubrobacter soli]
MFRVLCAIAVLAVAFVAAPAAAAAPADDAASIVSAFAALPQGDGGNVVDPLLKGNAYPYSQAMLGEAALRTWRRDGDPAALAFGERMLRWVSEHPSGPKPSFFALGATARAFELLPTRSPVRDAVARWLIAFPVPTQELVDYHSNKDLVLAEALTTLCRLALRPDTAAVCATAAHLLDVHLTARAAGYSVGPSGRRMTILVDPPYAPPAYQHLVLGYLAHIVQNAPRHDRAIERQLIAAARGSVAIVAPDGDAAYWGRSQEQSWAVVLGAYGLRVAASLDRDRAEAAQFRSVADAMVGRFDRVHRGGPYGVWIVPALREDPASRPPALDDYANLATYAGLTAVALTWLDLAPVGRANGRGRPVAAVFDVGEDAFATVRRGDVWFAVREHWARAHDGDLRSDFGLLAAERRGADGWRALVAVRPLTASGMDSGGPVLRTRSGQVGYPDGTALRVDRHRAVIVTGGWRDAGGRLLRRGTFRFSAVPGGVRLSFPVRGGDRIEYSVFGGALSGTADGVRSERARTTVSPGAVTIATAAGYASGDTSKLTRGTLSVTAPRTGRLTITVR